MTRGLLLLIVVTGALSGCASPEKQWYKPGVEYTVADWQRDRAACEKAGKLDEDCLKARGWAPLSLDREKPAPERVYQRGRY